MESETFSLVPSPHSTRAIFFINFKLIMKTLRLYFYSLAVVDIFLFRRKSEAEKVESTSTWLSVRRVKI